MELAGKRVAVSENVLVRELHGESVLLDLDSESYFGLDSVGTEMWEALIATPSLEAAYALLLEGYEVEPERLRADLGQFVEQLAAASLLDVRDL